MRDKEGVGGRDGFGDLLLLPLQLVLQQLRGPISLWVEDQHLQFMIRFLNMMMQPTNIPSILTSLPSYGRGGE